MNNDDATFLDSVASGTTASTDSLSDLSNLHGEHGERSRKSKRDVWTESYNWPEPKIIRAELLPVPTLPEELIPDVLLPWVKDVAHRMQTPLDFVAVGTLVMTGALIGTACCIRPKRKDDWQVIPNLFGGIVARPGKLKSPSLDAVTAPLTSLETAAKLEHDNKLKTYEADYAEFDGRKKGLQELIKESVKIQLHQESASNEV